MTVSIGVAQADPAPQDALALIQRADAAMYRAKAAGRNRVMDACATEPAPIPTDQPLANL